MMKLRHGITYVVSGSARTPNHLVEIPFSLPLQCVASRIHISYICCISTERHVESNEFVDASALQTEMFDTIVKWYCN